MEFCFGKHTCAKYLSVLELVILKASEQFPHLQNLISMMRIMVSYKLFWDRGLQLKDTQINYKKANIL